MIDLALPIENAKEEEKGQITSGLQPEIEYFDHKQTAIEQQKTYGLTEEQWPIGCGWEIIKSVAHSATHIDSPWHFGNEVNGEKARSVDELPLEWFYNDAFVLDFRDFDREGQVSLEDMKKAVEKINYEIKPLDIVLFNFDHDKHYGTPEYWSGWPGISMEAMEYLIEKGVKVFGTDSLGQDFTFSQSKEKYEKTKELKYIWETHQLGRKHEFCNIEKMTNLDKLPSSGFKVMCFPMPIKNGSGAWTRPVAVIED